MGREVRKMRKSVKQHAFSHILPICLLVVLLGIALVTVFMQADQFGITIDEPLQDQYGRSTMAWYESMGRDTSFLTSYPASDFQPQHGSAFETLVAAAQQVFDHQWYTRAVVTGIAGGAELMALPALLWGHLQQFQGYSFCFSLCTGTVGSALAGALLG